MADVTVYGAGIFGLAVAWACLRRGARVAVVDPHGVAAGSSGGIVGALAPHVPENWNAKKQAQFESLDMAARYWAVVAGAGGVDSGFARVGRLQLPADTNAVDLARARVADAARHWQGRYDWRVVDRSLWPGLLPPGSGPVVHDTLSARIHPRRACAALAASIRAGGGAIRPDPPRRVGREVWATGAAGLAALSEGMGRPLGSGVKGQAALFRADLGDAPQLFAEGLHVVPHGDGTVAVGSTSEREFSDPTATDARLDALIAAALRICPALSGTPVIERWAGVRPRARSRAPMLGPHPLKAGAFVANGGFKIGFGMAPKIGEMMADLVLDGRDAIPDAFRVEANL